jgi:hypothetical protein
LHIGFRLPAHIVTRTNKLGFKHRQVGNAVLGACDKEPPRARVAPAGVFVGLQCVVWPATADESQNRGVYCAGLNSSDLQRACNLAKPLYRVPLYRTFLLWNAQLSASETCSPAFRSNTEHSSTSS